MTSLPYDDVDDVIRSLENANAAIIHMIENIPDRGYIEFVNSLFRVMHSFKAHISYMELNEITSVIEKSEDILSFLRNNDCTIGIEIKNWFYKLSEQFEKWIDEFILLTEEYTPIINLSPPSFYDEYLDIPPYVHVSGYKMDRISSHRILLLLNDTMKMQMLEKILESTFTIINCSDSVEKISNILTTATEQKILISDIKFKDGSIVDIINKKLLTDTELFILSNLEINQIEKIKKILKTEHVYDAKTTDLKHFKTTVIKTIIPNEEYIPIPLNSTKISILDLTKSIKPMPEIIDQIKYACFENENIHYTDLAKIIEQDMAVTGKLLKQVNSPLFGLREPVTSIQKALVLLGKKNIYTATVQGIVDDLVGMVDISPYGIKYDDIIHINRLRTRLLKQWCAELGIPNSEFETINTISILLVLGTVLCAKALNYNLQDEKFKILRTPESKIHIIEKKLLDYTSFDVSHKIFENWRLPPVFIDVSEIMPVFKVNKNTQIKTEYYAYIISIIHSIIRIDGYVSISPHITDNLKENGFDSGSITNAYNKAFVNCQKMTTFTELIKCLEN